MATNGDGANVGRGVPELKRAIIEAGKKVNSAVHLTSFGLHDRACLYWPILRFHLCMFSVVPQTFLVSLSVYRS